MNSQGRLRDRGTLVPRRAGRVPGGLALPLASASMLLISFSVLSLGGPAPTPMAETSVAPSAPTHASPRPSPVPSRPAATYGPRPSAAQMRSVPAVSPDLASVDAALWRPQPTDTTAVRQDRARLHHLALELPQAQLTVRKARTVVVSATTRATEATRQLASYDATLRARSQAARVTPPSRPGRTASPSPSAGAPAASPAAAAPQPTMQPSAPQDTVPNAEPTSPPSSVVVPTPSDSATQTPSPSPAARTQTANPSPGAVPSTVAPSAVPTRLPDTLSGNLITGLTLAASMTSGQPGSAALVDPVIDVRRVLVVQHQQAVQAQTSADGALTRATGRRDHLLGQIQVITRFLEARTTAAQLAAATRSIATANMALYLGTAHFPLPVGSFTDLHNWGETGPHWASFHTGDDYSAACGTPVYAATDGTIAIVTDQSWAGPWLVQVTTGVGRLSTWYAHMEKVVVGDGQPVHAGQTIGYVGAMGNAVGCHLHFELHPLGGSIYADSTDPDPWLKATGAYPGFSPNPGWLATLGVSQPPVAAYDPSLHKGPPATPAPPKKPKKPAAKKPAVKKPGIKRPVPSTPPAPRPTRAPRPTPTPRPTHSPTPTGSPSSSPSPTPTSTPSSSTSPARVASASPSTLPLQSPTATNSPTSTATP